MADERVISPADRRRPRSDRVTLSVRLLGAAAAVVVLMLPFRSVRWLSVASVLAVLLGAAALRVLWTEVLQARRQNAADRAAGAAAYSALFSQRAAENAEFTTAMTARLAAAHLARREVEGSLAQEKSRAVKAEKRLLESQGRVEELGAELARLAEQRTDAENVLDWETNVQRATARKRAVKRKPA